jgi:hypothetical protein
MEGHLMKFAITLTVAALMLGTMGLAANAQTQGLGATDIRKQVQNATPIIDVQRCRCVERRWNGSCKLRVCRDHW